MSFYHQLSLTPFGKQPPHGHSKVACATNELLHYQVEETMETRLLCHASLPVRNRLRHCGAGR